MDSSITFDPILVYLKDLEDSNDDIVLNALHKLSEIPIWEDEIATILQGEGTMDKLLQLLGRENEEIMELSSSLIANLCGRTSSGSLTRSWNFDDICIKIKELSFVECDLGWQTWGSGAKLAKLIAEKRILVKGKHILELGCGTGLAGKAEITSKTFVVFEIASVIFTMTLTFKTSLTAAILGASHVLMTDYHHKVLENVEYNARLNDLDSLVTIKKLEWFGLAGVERESKNNEEIQETNETDLDSLTEERQRKFLKTNHAKFQRFEHDWNCQYEAIIAGDVIYDREHAEIFPQLIKKLLVPNGSSTFDCVLPGTNFREGIDLFEELMQKEFDMPICERFFKDTDPDVIELTYYQFKYKIN